MVTSYRLLEWSSRGCRASAGGGGRGRLDDRLLRHGIEESSVAFLQKPFSATELCEKVRQTLDG